MSPVTISLLLLIACIVAFFAGVATSAHLKRNQPNDQDDQSAVGKIR